jgi:2-oxo-3-hexenedioate decarboxylase
VAWKFVAAKTVAESGLHARLLIGPRVPVSSLARDADQLHRLLAGSSIALHCNGGLVDEGIGALALDSPLHTLMHFVAELRSCPGVPGLVAGAVVTTGTWTDAWPVQAGAASPGRIAGA